MYAIHRIYYLLWHEHCIYFYISVLVVTMMSEYDYVNKRRPTKVRWQVGDEVILR